MTEKIRANIACENLFHIFRSDAIDYKKYFRIKNIFCNCQWPYDFHFQSNKIFYHDSVFTLTSTSKPSFVEIEETFRGGTDRVRFIIYRSTRRVDLNINLTIINL